MKVDLEPFYVALVGKTAPYHKIVDWVFNNAGRPLEAIAHDEPPCFGAVKMLDWASNPAGYQTFMSSFVVKLLPDRKQIEAEERGKDDGRTLTLIARMEAEFYAAGPEEPITEPSVPARDSEAGSGKPVGPRRNVDGGQPGPGVVLRHVPVDRQPEGPSPESCPSVYNLAAPGDRNAQDSESDW